ncbi:MAG: tRNA 2-thiouridine(34) synthase MnmA [Clostridia bacterium]|nr:tRNA 2-thiouridine(34) synthase MnmA [Clostridia bacterium]
MNKDSILIAMSGGVDSAVSAYLTAQKHDHAAGVTMQLTSRNVGSEAAARRDIEGAATVCRLLGIPHYVAELGDIFRRTVVDYFISAYEAGETPNPCVYCNKVIKFGALLDFATANGFERLATGHYARIETSATGRMLLRRAADTTKDQTYVLYALSQTTLARCEFPLGSLSKAETRTIADQMQFPMAHQKDSQDICFVPDGDYASFILRMTGKTPTPGNFVSLDGTVLGEHKGQLHYTIGQRKGLGISLGKPAFVTAKSVLHNTVTLGDNADLFTARLTIRDINLIPFDRMDSPMRLLAKARYRQEACHARVEQTDEHTLTVEFETPQRAICPGQSLVLYDGDYVIGGGIIT